MMVFYISSRVWSSSSSKVSNSKKGKQCDTSTLRVRLIQTCVKKDACHLLNVLAGGQLQICPLLSKKGTLHVAFDVCRSNGINVGTCFILAHDGLILKSKACKQRGETMSDDFQIGQFDGTSCPQFCWPTFDICLALLLFIVLRARILRSARTVVHECDMTIAILFALTNIHIQTAGLTLRHTHALINNLHTCSYIGIHVCTLLYVYVCIYIYMYVWVCVCKIIIHQGSLLKRPSLNTKNCIRMTLNALLLPGTADWSALNKRSCSRY